MKRFNGVLLTGLLFGAPALFAAQSSAVNNTASMTGKGSVTITTVAVDADGSVTTTNKHLDLPRFYSQLGLAMPVHSGNGTSATGDEPPRPPAPGPGAVPDGVSKVAYTIIQNGWSRNTGYKRTAQPTPSGGYNDGPWGIDFDHLVPMPGNGGGPCNPKDRDDCPAAQN